MHVAQRDRLSDLLVVGAMATSKYVQRQRQMRRVKQTWNRHR